MSIAGEYRCEQGMYCQEIDLKVGQDLFVYATLRILDFTHSRTIKDTESLHTERAFKLALLRVCTNIAAMAMAR